MKREFSHNLTNHMEKKDDTVVVVRDDGKEFLINRSMLAEHINRGFTVNDNADQPSDEELSKAVGYKGPKGDKPEDHGAIDEGQEPADEAATVPEEKAKRKPAAKKAARKKAARKKAARKKAVRR